MVYSPILLVVLTVLVVGLTEGLHANKAEERRHGRGRLHQLCTKLLGDDSVTSKHLHTAHDRIRHKRQRSKCRIHLRNQERCTKRFKPANGTVHSYHDNFYGWVVNISCDRGYQLNGRSYIMCYEDIRKEDRPVCTIRDCGRPLLRNNSSVYIYNSTTYGSRLLVKCNSGFNLTGSASAKCSESGKWWKISRCVRKKCPEPKSLDYGRLHGTKNDQGARKLLFECAPGYRLVGDSEMSCLYGAWTSDTMPKCIQAPKEMADGVMRFIAISSGCAVLLFLIGFLIHLLFKWLRRRQRNDFVKQLKMNSSLEKEQPHAKNNLIINMTDQICIKRKVDNDSNLIEINNEFAERDCQKDVTSSTVEVVHNMIHEVVKEEEQKINRNSDQANDTVRRDGVCKEVAVSPRQFQSPICFVKPLQAGDDDTIATVENERVSGEVEPSQPAVDTAVLNWNKLFMYLVPKVCTDNWKLFAINLLSDTVPQGQSVNTVVSQIEMSSKTQHGGEKIEVILFNILASWRTRSKSASLTDIEKALHWSHNEDVIREMNNDIKEFYTSKEGIDGCSMNNGLKDIPELEYRIRPQEENIALFPCIEGEVFTDQSDRSAKVSGPVFPYSEELVTCGYRFDETDGFRYQRGKHYYRTKRQYSYPPFQNLRYQYKTHPRNRFPARSKPKVVNPPNKMENQITAGLNVSDMETEFVNLIFRVLDLDSKKTLNAMEYRMILKNILFKVQNAISSKTSMDDLMGITYGEYQTCEHVTTSRNGTLHIINSGDQRIILLDDIWTLLETYVLRARGDILSRIPDTDEQYLFLMFEGGQVTREYVKVNDTEVTEPIDATERTEIKTDPNSCEQPVTIDTSNAEKPTSESECKPGEAFDFKRRLPISRNSSHVHYMKQEALDTEQNGKHRRRYFCENQTTTIANVFNKEIKQGSVKETTILCMFHSNSELRGAFGVQPNEVTKILVKKVADRVRCFIRKQKNR